MVPFYHSTLEDNTHYKEESNARRRYSEVGSPCWQAFKEVLDSKATLTTVFGASKLKKNFKVNGLINYNDQN